MARLEVDKQVQITVMVYGFEKEDLERGYLEEILQKLLQITVVLLMKEL